MAAVSRADKILVDIEKGCECLEFLGEGIRECFLDLKSEDKTSVEFASKCLSVIALSVPAWQSQETLDRVALRSLVSIVQQCFDNIQESGCCFTLQQHTQICRCLYNILATIHDVSHLEALRVANVLISGITVYEATTNSFPGDMSVFAASVGPIARNSFVILWNAAIEADQLPSDALELRLGALTLLSFSSSDSAKFCDKAVNTALVYCAMDEKNVQRNGGGCDDLSGFCSVILDIFRRRIAVRLGTLVEGPTVLGDVFRLLQVCVSHHLKYLWPNVAMTIIEKARCALQELSSTALHITCESLSRGLSILEVSVALCRLTVGGCQRETGTVAFLKDALPRCATYLQSNCPAKRVFLELKCFSFCLNPVRQQLCALVEKATEDPGIAVALDPVQPSLTAFVLSIARTAAKENAADAITMLNIQLLYQSYHLKAVLEASLDASAVTQNATQVTGEYHTLLSKLVAGRRAKFTAGFLTAAFNIVSVLYNARLYAEALPFSRPYVDSLFASFDARDQEKSAMFWKRMSILIVCLNRANQYHESLQVIAQFLARDLGQDGEAMKLWVSVKKEARRVGVTLMTVTTRQSVGRGFRVPKSRLKFLSTLELRALKGPASGFSDEMYAVLRDLYETAEDATEKSSVLIQMARVQLCRDKNDVPQMSSADCCREAIKLLKSEGKRGSAVVIFAGAKDCLLVQARFLLYLAGVMERYDFLDEKLSIQQQRLDRLKEKQRLEAEKFHMLLSEKDVDENDGDEDVGAAANQLSTLHEEVSSLAGLDRCLHEWRSILDAESDAVPCVEDVMDDLKCAAEICSNACIYRSEVLAWELFLTLAKRNEKRLEYAVGVTRLCVTLARLGLTKRARPLLEEAISCTGEVSSTADAEATHVAVSLLLTKSECLLMENRIEEGWQCLRDAIDRISRLRRGKQVVLLESEALLLRSKYRELPASLLSRDASETLSPIDSAMDALRLCTGLLKSSSEDHRVITFHLKQRMIGCLLNCSFRLGQLYYDIGSPREARCYLGEKLTWTQRFFYVHRTVEVLLLLARVDLLCGSGSNCQVKLSAVRYVMDSTDELCFRQSPSSSPLHANDSCANEDGELIMRSLDRSEKPLAKLVATSPRTSPLLSAKQSLPSLTCAVCGDRWSCAKCQQIIALRLRAQYLFVQHELCDGWSVTSKSVVLRLVKSLSKVERSLLLKIGSGDDPVSFVDIATCCALSRSVGSLLDIGDHAAALQMLKTATSKADSFRRLGIGQLHFLKATLAYQDCLLKLLVRAGDEAETISGLCAKAWSSSKFSNSCNPLEDRSELTVRLASLELTDLKEPKTPKKRVPFICQAPVKKLQPLSIFENNFSSDEEEEHDQCGLPATTLAAEVSADVSQGVNKCSQSFEEDSCRTGADNRVTVEEDSLADVLPVSARGVTQSYKINSELICDDNVHQNVGKENRGANGKCSLEVVKTSVAHVGTVWTEQLSSVSSAESHGSPLGVANSLNIERSRREEPATTESDRFHRVPLTTGITAPVGVAKGQQATSCRLTRSKASALAEQDAEIFRRGSPKGRQAKQTPAGKKNPVAKSSDVRRNILRRMADQGTSVGIRDAIAILEKVLHQIKHHPHVPLYGDLNLLLALCRGDSDKQCVGNVLESVGVTFRHYVCTRLAAKIRMAVNLDEASPTVEARHKVLSFREGSFLFSNVAEFQCVSDKLPKDWVVCQINTLPTLFSGDSKNPELIVTRLECNRRPLMARIACPEITVGARDFFSEFNDIMSEKMLKIRVSVSKQWWEIRKSLDARLKGLLHSMEDAWFGMWKCLLLGKLKHAKDQLQLKVATHEALCRLKDLGIVGINQHLLELVVDAWPWMKPRHLAPALAMVCELVSTDPRLKEVCCIIQSVGATMWNREMDRQVVVLVLDKVVHQLPLENLPILRGSPVTRMPSVHFLLGHLAIHKVVDDSETDLPEVDVSKAFFVLNPSSDLARTEEMFKDFFHGLNWPGIVRKAPTKDEWTTALNTRDLFVYCGHGAGSRYAAGEVINKRFCRATAILMGCSSAFMKNQGPNLEPHGILLQYLAAGCPCLIGNLWDVTDRDIDRLLETLLKGWLPGVSQKSTSLLLNLPSARNSTLLRYLIGAAPVTYGIPVFTKSS